MKASFCELFMTYLQLFMLNFKIDFRQLVSQPLGLFENHMESSYFEQNTYYWFQSSSLI